MKKHMYSYIFDFKNAWQDRSYMKLQSVDNQFQEASSQFENEFIYSFPMYVELISIVMLFD